MNQIFSLPRFGNYCMKFYTENYKDIFFMFLGITIALSLIIMTDEYYISYGINLLVFFIFSIINASRFSRNINPRAKKIEFLLTPASPFEKFLSYLLHIYVAIPIIYAIALLCAQYLAMLITTVFTLTPYEWTLPFSIVQWGSDSWVFMMVWMTSVAYFFFGSTVWTKNSLLASLAIVFFFGFFCSSIWSLGAVSMLFDKDWTFILNASRAIDNIENIMTVGVITISVLSTLAFLTIGYMRITEYEVNETKH